jgi:hypothetical protein
MLNTMTTDEQKCMKKMDDRLGVAKKNVVKLQK